MKSHNPENTRIKRQYFNYLRNAKGQSEATIDAAAKALERFEEYTRMKPFKAFNHQQAVGFKNHLAEQYGQRSTKKLSKATLYATLTNLKRFFQWLSGQPGFKSRFQYSDADYFSLNDKDARIATTKRDRPAPTLEQVRHVILNMPAGTSIEKRNRAVLAFTLLTGARDGAIASMKLKHIDIHEGRVYQDARDVKTKFSKSFATWFFPVGEDIRAIVEDWVAFLHKELLWGSDDPLFPATEVTYNQATHQFEAVGLSHKGWSNATPIRDIFKVAFTNAGLPYFNPHSLRNTLVQLGEKLCQTPEDFKTWSQNLGHEKVLTTFTSYGEVSTQRQKEIMIKLADPKTGSADTHHAEAIAEAVVRKIKASHS